MFWNLAGVFDKSTKNVLFRGFQIFTVKSVFSLIFNIMLSMKTRLLGFINLWWMRRGEDINKIYFDVLEDHYDYFWTCQIFIFIKFFFPKLKIIYLARYRQKSSEGEFDILEWRWPRVRNKMSKNLWRGEEVMKELL